MSVKPLKEKFKWEFLVNRTYLPLSISLSCFDNNKRCLDKVLPVSVGDIYASYKNHHYFGQHSLEIFSKTQIEKFKIDGPKFLWRMARLCVKNGEKLIQLSGDFRSVDYSHRSNKEIVKALLKFCQSIRAFSVFLLYPLSLGNFFENNINHLVSNHEKDFARISEWKKVLAEPIKMNESQREQIAFFKLAHRIKETSGLVNMTNETERRIRNYLKKYSWLQMRWLIGRPTDIGDVIKRLNHLFDEGDIVKKINFFEEKSKKTNKSAKNFIYKFKINKNDEEIIWLLKEYVFLRTYRTDVINQALFCMMPILEESSSRLSIPYDDLLLLSPEEICQSLDNGSLLKDIKIEDRKKSWALLRKKEEIHIFQGEEADKFAEKQGFLKAHPVSTRSIIGQIGYTGIVRGVVKIIITPNDVWKVSKGEIMVAVMTFPSYIVAMEKAVAFITDDGGILCHAAIVAREMKKPCIIGTKIATKVLKDGDLVEVDADKGVVKIIKRA